MKINQRFGLIVILLPITVLVLSNLFWAGLELWKHEQLPTYSETEIRQVLQEGMTPSEVESALGEPETNVENENDAVWGYHNNPPSGFPKLITVIFRNGRVTEIVLVTPKVYRP